VKVQSCLYSVLGHGEELVNRRGDEHVRHGGERVVRAGGSQLVATASAFAESRGRHLNNRAHERDMQNCKNTINSSLFIFQTKSGSEEYP
jgi:hypothetical protein